MQEIWHAHGDHGQPPAPVAAGSRGDPAKAAELQALEAARDTEYAAAVASRTAVDRAQFVANSNNVASARERQLSFY